MLSGVRSWPSTFRGAERTVPCGARDRVRARMPRSSAKQAAGRQDAPYCYLRVRMYVRTHIAGRWPWGRGTGRGGIRMRYFCVLKPRQTSSRKPSWLARTWETSPDFSEHVLCRDAETALPAIESFAFKSAFATALRTLFGQVSAVSACAHHSLLFTCSIHIWLSSWHWVCNASCGGVPDRKE